MPGKAASPAPNLVLLAALYGVEASIALLGLALYKKGGTPLGSFLVRPAGVYLVASCLGLVAFAGLGYRVARRLGGSGSRVVRYTALLNLIPVVLLAAAGEIVVRGLSTSSYAGSMFLGKPLPPRSWRAVVEHMRDVTARASSGGAWVGSFLVFDDQLGWTVGASRQSQTRLSASSVEGIRSPRPGISFAEVQHVRRIALVGDSYTFGLDVAFEESWGGRLQARLGDEFQILNFGVDGYGIDQAYLRYQRDVRPWQPELVLFGMIEHDLYRTMGVYAFIGFPSWELPFAKPRFVLEAGALRLVNTPLPTAEQILATESVRRLPFVDLDPGYDPAEWEWQAYHASYTARFVLSRFPRWRPKTSDATPRAMREINAAILRAFLESAESDGAIPLLVYLPSRGAGDFDDPPSEAGVARSILREIGHEFVDLRECVRAVPRGQRFLPDKPHYSVDSNSAVADCLDPRLRRLLEPARTRSAAARSSNPPRPVPGARGGRRPVGTDVPPGVFPAMQRAIRAKSPYP